MQQKTISSWLRTVCSATLLVITLALFSGCTKNVQIVSDVNQREANEIIVFLASKGITASKAQGAASAGAQGEPKWSILVDEGHSTAAMAILNQNGLPRVKGMSLLDLFGKPSMMSSEKEGVIRYQAGLAEQIATTIRKIDGVIDADVQISFPSTDSSQQLPWEEAAEQKVSASVYVKHQGVLDDPNSHLITKIKRLVSGSIQDLDINNVTVISDKARFTDLQLNQTPEALLEKEKGYVSIWSIVMSKTSASRFRALFFFLSLFVIVLGVVSAWLLWKMYPSIKRAGGFKGLLSPAPFPAHETVEEHISPEGAEQPLEEISHEEGRPAPEEEAPPSQPEA